MATDLDDEPSVGIVSHELFVERRNLGGPSRTLVRWGERRRFAAELLRQIDDEVLIDADE